MAKRSPDLQRFLPARYRDKAIDTFLENTVGQLLTRDDTELLYGYVGSEEGKSSGDLYLTETELERKLNQLQAIYDITLGTERSTLSWSDFMQRLVTLGVDPAKLGSWLKTEAHNFAPPISFDKLINYGSYVWIGPWIQNSPSVNYTSLGVSGAGAVSAAAATSNPDLLPEHYVIEAGGSTAWSTLNLWVHVDDARQFAVTHPVEFGDLTASERPIVELSRHIQLNSYVDAQGQPNDAGTLHLQTKVARNQPPQFDLYHYDGLHAGRTSMLFYFNEDQSAPVDEVVGRRLVRDSDGELEFSHGFVDPETNRLLFAKIYDQAAGQQALRTIWSSHKTTTNPVYSKYDRVGTVINTDKFKNFRNYYWTGTVATGLPSWNPTGLAEYSVIEAGGTSPWSTFNYWKHISELDRSQLDRFARATKPIIEFNVRLEAELTSSVKTVIHQLPKFKLYNEDGQQIPAGSDPHANDSFTMGAVLCRFNDLSDDLQRILDGTPDVARRLTFTYNGERFVASLASGKFATQSGSTVYGFTPRVLHSGNGETPNSGNGLVSLTTTTAAVPQGIKLTALSPTTFSVKSTLGTSYANLTVGSNYAVITGLTINVAAGTSAFVAGDSFLVEIRSVLFEDLNYYIKLGSTTRTFDSSASIISDTESVVKVAGTPSAGDGAWETPVQLLQNINNETRTVLREGDLIDHFSSIIAAQNGFEGSPIGSNNSRTLTILAGRGGAIKQHSSRFQLLLGLLAQRDFSARDLFEFSSKSYDRMLNSVREFVEVELASRLETLDVMGGTVQLSDELFNEAITYIEGKTTSALEADRPFFLSTMPIKALALTLPYLGLASSVLPQEKLDLELNIQSLVHHDGHLTPLATVDFDVLKRIVQRKVPRSNGQTTAGFVGGSTFPTKPFAKQLWLDLGALELRIYDAVSDTGELPANASIGQFSYDRATGEVWMFNGTWVSIGLGQEEAPWRPINLSKTLQSLLLKIETVLYNNVIAGGSSNQAGGLAAMMQPSTDYWPSMQREFELFAAEQGVDPYANNYDASNPFSWNYSTGPGTKATWQEVYRVTYGTSRPDIEPWIPAGYANEAAFLAAAITGGYLPGGTTKFLPSHWAAVATWVRSRYVTTVSVNKLSVNVSTGELIPPYAFGHAEQLNSAVPPTPSKTFSFFDQGPVELVWRRSSAYASAHQLSLFRVNPLALITDFWGETITRIGVGATDGYWLQTSTSVKPGIYCDVHGEPELPREEMGVIATVLTPANVTYTFTAGKFKMLVNNGATSTVHAGYTYSDSVISFSIVQPTRGVNVGDKFTVVINGATATVTQELTSVKLLCGYGQLFSQLVRSLGSDESISSSTELLRSWKVSLGYDTGKIISSGLSVLVDQQPLAQGTYDLVLKERHLGSVGWYSSLKVTLVRAGTSAHKNGINVPAAGATGQPGDDWVFKVETFSPGRRKIEWYEPSASRQTFFALSTRRSKDEWTRAAASTTLRTTTSPVLITGLQATVDFVFGVAARYTDLGFIVDGHKDLASDPDTSRPRDWQFLVESFVDQQFGGVQNGSSFLFDPLANRMFFEPSVGELSEIRASRSLTSVYSTLFGGSGESIRDSKVFRASDTTIVPSQPIYSAKLTTSKFEHTLVLDDMSGSVTVFDSFLGRALSRAFLQGRFSFNEWKPESGSHFLTSSGFGSNIEGSIADLTSLYDTSVEALDDPAKRRARAMLGYTSKDYYQGRSTPELTQFRFWQGAMKAKGTVRAIEAFVNAKQYQTASVDEYWAYRVAQYGDARLTVDAEIKLEPEDTFAERTNLLFLEDDELNRLDEDAATIKTDFYDVSGYDVPPYDTELLTIPTYSAIYTASQAEIMEPNNVHAAIMIRPTDESRWFRYDELGSIQYLEADLIATAFIVPDRVDRCYKIIDSKTGKEVNADCFELVDTLLLTSSDSYDVLPYDTAPYGGEAGAIYRETGELITNTSPPSYTVPKFRRLNHCVIKIDDPLLLGRSLQVNCYGPAIKKYSPSKLASYSKTEDRTITDDIIWWDPKRGSHSPQAHALVNLQTSRDPAVYNRAYVLERSSDKARPWNENQVGKVWWDTSLSEWLPYSDTKIRPNFEARKAVWGALKDFGEIPLYEWIESSVPPLEYDSLPDDKRAGSTVGFINKIFRTRTWQGRPVAWLKTDDPRVELWAPTNIGTGTLWISGTNLYAIAGTLPQFEVGEKIAIATFNGSSKVAAALEDLRGEIVIRELAKPAIIALFYASGFSTNKTAVLSPGAFDFGSSLVNITMTTELDGGVPYLRATLSNNRTQRLTIADTPPVANTLVELNFDQLGFSLKATITYDRSAPWPVTSAATPADRVMSFFNEMRVSVIGVYSVYTIEQLIPLGTNVLPSLSDDDAYSWISWKDPTAYELSNDSPAPFNKWKPFAGTFNKIESITPAIAAEIKARYEYPWSAQPFEPIWTGWQVAKPQILRTVYCTFGQSHQQSLQTLQFQALEEQARNARVYINGLYKPHGVKLNEMNTGYYDVPSYDSSPYDATTVIPTWYFDIDEALLSQGDEIVVIVPPINPTAQQLATDLSTAAADPTVSIEWRTDAPHVAITHRSLVGASGETKYYFWVRGKETAPRGKTMSIAQAEQQLRSHDDYFGAPQILKFYNQMDGRPNRYAILSVRGMSWSVVIDKTYKIRIKRIASMRDDDLDMTLRPIHTEWKLIRAKQPSRIPFELWSVLTDTLCGETQAGQELPAIAFTDYDARDNIIPASWGFELPRVLCPPGVARATFKSTVLSPSAKRFDPESGTMVSNPLAFSGFDVTKIDDYLDDATSVRELMGSIWKNADPKQINELFFAVLEDSLTYTRELPGLFKTSYIAVDDVRTSNTSNDSIL